MSFIGKLLQRKEKPQTIDDMVSDLDIYMQGIKMKQKNASRRSAVCKSAIEKILKEKQELFKQVTRLMDEGKDDRAKSYIATMQKLETQENVLAKEEEVYRQRVFEYTPLVLDIDLLRKDLLYNKALGYLNPDVKEVNIESIIGGFNKIREYMTGSDMTEPIQLRGYMISKESMLDAQTEIGEFDIYDEDVDHILDDISKNINNYSQEIQDAYTLVNNTPVCESTISNM